MEVKLMELRRYAIDNRIEIKFIDPASGTQCMINAHGHVKVLGEDKELRIEDVIEAADTFEIVESGKVTRLTREGMAKSVSEAFKNRGFAVSVKEED